MKVYQIICTTTCPEMPAVRPYIETEASYYTLREAEEHFARIVDDYIDDKTFDCELTDEYFKVVSKTSNLYYWYEIHPVEIREAR